MRSFVSTRPSPLATVVGPPVAVVGASGAMAIGAAFASALPVSPLKSMARPPNGSLSFITDIVAPLRYSPRVSGRPWRDGVLQGLQGGDDLGQPRDPIGVVHVGDAEDYGVRTGVRELAEAVDHVVRRLAVTSTIRGQVHALQGRALDLRRIATDRRAMLVEDAVLAGDH